jgi:DNA-binding transcriptional MocR family regulator
MLPDALEKTVAKNHAKGVFLMPTCANPTTITMSVRRKNDLSSTIEKLGLLVLEDDATLIPDGSGTFFERLPDQTFHLSGATRFLAPGLRATFAVSPMHCLKRLQGAHHRLTIKASALDAEIMSELILNGRAQKILAEKVRSAKEMNARFNRIFPHEWRSTSNAPFFRTIALPAMRSNGPEVERELLSEGVRACHSYRFTALKKPPYSFLRISLSSINSKQDLTKGLKTVRQWLNRRIRNGH